MQIGDVVVLKSGGPVMTIGGHTYENLSEDDKNYKIFNCYWFEKTDHKEPRFGIFHEDTLWPVPAKGKK